MSGPHLFDPALFRHRITHSRLSRIVLMTTTGKGPFHLCIHCRRRSEDDDNLSYSDAPVPVDALLEKKQDAIIEAKRVILSYLLIQLS